MISEVIVLIVSISKKSQYLFVMIMFDFEDHYT